MGLKRVVASDCLFMMTRNGAMALILIYVDGLGLLANENLIKFAKVKLRKNFQLTDIGESTFFLGVLISESGRTNSLTQKPLIQ